MAPVMGSRSLNATRNGLSQAASCSQAARLAGAAGSSRRWAPGRAWRGRRPGSWGRGTAPRRRRAPPRKRGLAAGCDQPRHVQRRRGSHHFAEPQPDLGHLLVAGGQPGVGRDHAGEPVRVLGDQPQPDQAAPVLPDQGYPAQVQRVEGERPDPLHVPRVAVVADLGRLVRPAEPDQVGGDRAQPGGGEHRHHVPVEERPARLAVQQQHRLAVGRARPRRRPSAGRRRRRSAPGSRSQAGR